MANKFLTDRHQEPELVQAIKIEYPKWLFKGDETPLCVDTAEEHLKLEKDGWAEEPNAEPTKGKKK